MGRKKAAGKESRNWVWTLNNYTVAEVDYIKSTTAKVKFIGFGFEVGENETPHLQGMVCFETARSMGATKKVLCVDGKRVHVEIMRESPRINWDYCSKQADVWFKGEVPKDRAQVAVLNKENYQELIKMAQAGDFDGIIEKYPKQYLQYHSAIHRVAVAHMKRPEKLGGVCGLWIYGKPGTGKTRLVDKYHPDAYPKAPTRWWDGYQNEDVVLLDDLDPHQGSFIIRFLKIWADYKPFLAEVKGGCMYVRPKKFIVTSNWKIEEMNFHENDMLAVRRRFTEIEKIEGEEPIIW